MKTAPLILLFTLTLMTLGSVSADGRRSYGDAWYDLEKKYPSPERRYTRKELEQARRRANNALWMDTYGRKDPIYQSNQYRGRSYGGYNNNYNNFRKRPLF